MNDLIPAVTTGDDTLLVALARCLDPWRTAPSGAEGHIIVDHIEELTGLGLLAAPLPRVHDGLGWGSEAQSVDAVCLALQLLGQSSLALGRVFEGHLNAIRLLHRLADVAQFRGVAGDVCGAHPIGLWVTSFADPVRVVQIYRVERRCGARLMCVASSVSRGVQ